MENKKRHKDLNPEELDRYRRNSWYKTKYGITLEQYEEMLGWQEHRCWVCNAHEDDLKKKLAVDHCHETNVVRGLLCGSCNMAIGLLKDDETLLKRAIDYLKIDWT